MKKWNAVFWRMNPQLKNGGYETTRTVEAKTAASAAKKAEKQYGHPIYGGMVLMRVEEVEA